MRMRVLEDTKAETWLGEAVGAVLGEDIIFTIAVQQIIKFKLSVKKSAQEI